MVFDSESGVSKSGVSCSESARVQMGDVKLSVKSDFRRSRFFSLRIRLFYKKAWVDSANNNKKKHKMKNEKKSNKKIKK